MPAVRVTSVNALDALFAKVAPALGRDAGEPGCRGRGVFVKGTPSKGLAWKDACKLIGTEPISVDGQWEDGLSGSGTSGVQFRGKPASTRDRHREGARILAIQDCGLSSTS